MHESNSQNAMTEVALALAMGFFSLMVLTLVSMGAGTGETSEAVAFELSRPVEGTPTQARTELEQDDQFILYYQGRFLDRGLKPIAPTDLDPEKRTILGLGPDLPLSEAMSVRSQFATINLVITTLDNRWISTLKESLP
jgi:hypothetical protein